MYLYNIYYLYAYMYYVKSFCMMTMTFAISVQKKKKNVKTVFVNEKMSAGFKTEF